MGAKPDLVILSSICMAVSIHVIIRHHQCPDADSGREMFDRSPALTITSLVAILNRKAKETL